MPVVTWELVKPLIARSDVGGNHVQAVFACPVSGEEVHASAPIRRSQGSALKQEVKQSLWRNIRWSLSRMMYSTFGYGVGGAIGQAVADGAMSAASSSGFSEDEIRASMVDAFKSVQTRFAWDDSNQRFVSASVYKDLQTEFAVLVQSHPITKAWDQGVLARMLAEIASADGQLAEEERELFHAFLPVGQGVSNLDALLEKPPLTKAELEEVSAECRHVMWLVAAGMACADESTSEAELALLQRFGAALGVSPDDQARGLELAREYIFDQALEVAYTDRHLEKAEVDGLSSLAEQLGISEDRAQRLDVRCRKRKGIF
jgi:uncharacterized tellurite resistance protein B-like protein